MNNQVPETVELKTTGTALHRINICFATEGNIAQVPFYP